MTTAFVAAILLVLFAAHLGSYVDALLCTAVTASSAAAQSAGMPAGEVLKVDSKPTEPAVPLNVAVTVRVVEARRLIEVTAIIAKRAGFPSEMFVDRNVKGKIALPPGLDLVAGSLDWSGDVIGDEVTEFTATVRALTDVEGIVEVTATGEALGGGIDADRERFLVVTRGDRVEVALEPSMQVPALGSGNTVAPRTAVPVQ